MSKAYVGIDPGATGAVAFINPDGKLAVIWDVDGSVVGAIAAIRKAAHLWMPNMVAAIEKVGTMPGQGVASQGKFLAGAGMLKGALLMGEIPIIAEPTPVQWKRLMGIPMNPPKPPKPLKQCAPDEKKAHRARLAEYKRDQKTISRNRATELFPEHADKFALKKHDGRAEAALLAEYCRRIDQGAKREGQGE